MNLLRIKWENITAIGYIVLATIANVRIFIAEGFDFSALCIELVLMSLMVLMIVSVIGTIRKSFLNL